jgi:hypothetical protein
MGCLPGNTTNIAAARDFPSWTTNSPAKNTIIEFVEDVTNPGSADFVDVADRIAVFDNDGTLWSEYPTYFQALFLEDHGLGSGETPEDYRVAAHDFVTTETNMAFDQPYIDLIYKPMVEFLNYLRAHDFQVYICSGGEDEFIRAFAEKYYGVSPQNIIGSLLELTFDKDRIPPAMVRVVTDPMNPFIFVNDKGEKPVGIQRHIGKRPILTVGNSNGDLQMLQYTDDGEGKELMMVLNHDDEEREKCADEDCNDHIQEVLDEAADRGWTLISIKHDFDKVFSGPNLP